MDNIFYTIMESLGSSDPISVLQMNSNKFEVCGKRIQGLSGYIIEPRMGELSDDDKNLYIQLFKYLKLLINEQDYQRYIELLKAGDKIFTKLWWNFSRNPIMSYDYGFSKLNEYKARFRQTQPEKPITINKMDRLFHTSSKQGLTKLTPYFKSVHNGTVETLYPNKRIYFSKNYPMNRTGFNWNGEGRVYEYKFSGTVNAKIDEEMGKPACFIVTDSDIPVVDVTDEILKNKKNFEYDIFETDSF
jgi:hypothetical protein